MTTAVTTPTNASAPAPVAVGDPDYGQFLFRPERANYHTDFVKGIQWVTDRAKSNRTVQYSSVKAMPNGQITIGSATFDCTKWAFEQFCARLGIPRPFARKIPPDLLLSNIARLIQEASLGDDATLGFHFASFGGTEVIVGCTKDDYQFIEAPDFLTASAAMDGTGYKLHDLIITDRIIDVDLLMDQKVITTKDKTQYNVMVNLRSSDCGDVAPTARLALYDATLQTAFVLSTEWGRVDVLRNKKMTLETRFSNFMGKVIEMIVPEPQLIASLDKVAVEYATDVEVQNWYSTFNRAIDNKETIDSLLGWTEDERKSTFKEIGIRRKNNQLNKLQGMAVQPDPVLNFTKRDLGKKAAEYAKDAVLEERETLRRLAGSFVNLG